jgi:hypothetical protein
MAQSWVVVLHSESPRLMVTFELQMATLVLNWGVGSVTENYEGRSQVL